LQRLKSLRLGIHCVYKASSFASARVIAWLGASVNEIGNPLRLQGK